MTRNRTKNTMHLTQNPYATPLFLVPRQERPPRRELTKDEVEEINFAFSTLDSGKTGFVTPRQLKVALRAMGFPVKKAEVTDLLDKHGEDTSASKISYDSFRRLVSDKLSDRTPQDDMRRAFQLFDVNGNGKIDVYTLKRVTKSLGMDISEEELKDMVNEFDLDRDGMINEVEFMSIMAATQE